MEQKYYQEYLKEKKVVVILLLAAVLIIGLTVYFAKHFRAEEKVGKEKIATPASETPEVKLPLQPGEVGEPKKLTKAEEEAAWQKLKEKILSSLPSPTPTQPSPTVVPTIASLPPVIFNTTGTITEVKADRIIVAGSGSNFVDQLPRDLNVIFTRETTTFSLGQTLQVQGFGGLKKLVPGMKISIQGDENIRGKTEFKARYINIL